jgi:hypothetical protein
MRQECTLDEHAARQESLVGYRVKSDARANPTETRDLQIVSRGNTESYASSVAIWR